jgi:Bacteriophage tail sheath protein
MPASYTYPGVYVEELPSGVHPIAGVATSNTAFVDYFSQGPINQPVNVTSWADFTRQFGGLNSLSEASYGVQQFFLNGGTSAWIVRITDAGQPTATPAVPGNPAEPAKISLSDASSTDVLDITAGSPGSWGDELQVAVDQQQPAGSTTQTFNLVVRQATGTAGSYQVLASEVYRNLSLDSTSPSYAPNAINGVSALITVAVPSSVSATDLPAVPSGYAGKSVADPTIISSASIGPFTPLAGGADGATPQASDFVAGIQALDQMAPFIFNLLCLPAAANLDAADCASVLGEAVTYCESKRAYLLVDIPQNVQNATAMIDLLTGSGSPLPAPSSAAGVYFPRLQIPDPLANSALRDVGSSGTVAGVIARIDASRGVWKSAAGTEATILGANLVTTLNDADNGSLNILGVNVLRSFPVYGSVVWGARTMLGADQQASEWKYAAVRRTADYIEESLVEGLKWVVFEPNDAGLWAQIRLNVSSFMNGLFRQGAFAGVTPTDAYLVKCDSDTTTPADVDNGVVNIIVGFMPLAPAEFVVLQIEQLAGQSS